MSFNFSIPTTALFGAGKLNELHTQINTPMGAVHGKNALVVISNGKSTRANGYLDRLENELKQAGVEYVIFDKVSSNPIRPCSEPTRTLWKSSTPSRSTTPSRTDVRAASPLSS